jgi:hypothetical protein
VLGTESGVAAYPPAKLTDPIPPNIHISEAVLASLTDVQIQILMQKLHRPYLDFVGEVVVRAFPEPGLRDQALQLWTSISFENLPVQWEGIAAVWHQIISICERDEQAMSSLTTFMGSSEECAVYYTRLLTTGSTLLRDSQVRKFVLKTIPWVFPPVLLEDQQTRFIDIFLLFS